MKKLIVLFFIVISLIIKCTVPPQTINRISFNPNEYENIETTGTSKIKGQAFIATRGGDVKYGAGRYVILNPVTSYSTDFYNKTVLNGLKLPDPDPRIFKYIKTTRADGFGNFEFENIAPGKYYIYCPIFWEIPTSNRYMKNHTGGYAYCTIIVNENETVKAILTR